MAGNTPPRTTREALLDQLFSDQDELLNKVEALQKEIPAASDAMTKAIKLATKQATKDLETASMAVHDAMGSKSSKILTDVDNAAKRIQQAVEELNEHQAIRHKQDSRLLRFALLAGVFGGVATAALVGIVAAVLII